jgi:hypothetical protein
MKDVENSKIITVFIFLIMVFIAGFLAYTILFQTKLEPVHAPVVDPEAGLGMPGAACGGDLRLPCMPGSTCQITNVELNEGVCVHVTDNPGPAVPPVGNNQ